MNYSTNNLQARLPIGALPLGLPDNFLIADQTTGETWASQGMPYSTFGPFTGLNDELILVTSDNINVNAQVPNVFIKTGGGEDALNVSEVDGDNILDGSTGSNFIVGGSGHDTFFIDDRSPSAAIWTTISGFHPGDAATVFGVTQADFAFDWINDQGADGYTGLTLHATAPGQPVASLTLTGFSTTDLSNGRLSVAFGTERDGTPFMQIQGV